MSNVIVTIARQYGSGGREVGKLLAAKERMEYYDKNMIALASEKSGLDHDVIKEADEKATGSLLYAIAMGVTSFGARGIGTAFDLPINDKLFVAQTQVIKEAAENNSCVFVGRCADYVLKDEPKCIRVFIYSDFDARLRRVMESHPDLPESKVRDMIMKSDKQRANYYNYYTGNKWGKHENYDLMINTSKVGMEGAARLIADYIRMSEK